jgi:dihydrolipoamide dehydrogenase
MTEKANAISVAVIGGGPGGYVAAIRAAQLGGKVTLIEKNRMGGTCLNVGCIPTKSILHSAELLSEVKHASDSGILVKVEGFDWEKVQKKKAGVVEKLVGGVTGLMKANGVTVISGTAEFTGRNTLSVAKADGTKETLNPDRIIIAAGSEPVVPPIPGLKDNPACMDSTGALSLDKVPKTMLVIGGGVIGIELAVAYNQFGTSVTIVEAMPKLLPMMDGELTAILRKRLEKDGIKILTSTKVLSVEKSNAGAAVSVEFEGKTQVFEAEKVLVATGRRASTADLKLDAAGIANERGKITVNDKMETNVPNVYAIGDCLGKVMLAHVASAQGEIAAENALGENALYDGRTNPSCVYTNPEFAGAGLTEEQAKEKGVEYTVGKFPFAANGKGLIANGGEGVVKFIVGKEYKEILGVHILGPRATDLIAECALSIGMEATIDDLVSTIHAHPTLAEAVREAALAADKRAIHIPNK